MTAPEFTIRQSDFAAEHKLKPGEVKALRDKHLVEGEDWTTKVRAILWTQEAAERVKGFLGAPIEPETHTVLVLKPCRNKRFAYASLDGIQIGVNCGRFRDKLLRKRIQVRKDGESYIYAPNTQ